MRPLAICLLLLLAPLAKGQAPTFDPGDWKKTAEWASGYVADYLSDDLNDLGRARAKTRMDEAFKSVVGKKVVWSVPVRAVTPLGKDQATIYFTPGSGYSTKRLTFRFEFGPPMGKRGGPEGARVLATDWLGTVRAGNPVRLGATIQKIEHRSTFIVVTLSDATVGQP